jgi:hypothetical protein
VRVSRFNAVPFGDGRGQGVNFSKRRQRVKRGDLLLVENDRPAAFLVVCASIARHHDAHAASQAGREALFDSCLNFDQRMVAFARTPGQPASV